MSEDVTRARLSELKLRVASGAALVRCDGTRADVTNYRLGREVPGWNVRGACERGDILVDTQGTGRHRLIVAITPVDSTTKAGEVHWNEGEDVPPFPAVAFATAAGPSTTRLWSRLSGPPAEEFLDTVIALDGARPRITTREGRRYVSQCRTRSSGLRAAALDLHAGACQACGCQPRVDFGPDGDRAIDVHHHVPLSESGEVVSALEDVAVVCAACHRLLHMENPPLPVTAIAHRVRRGLKFRESGRQQ